jgi:hypothetical protein
MFDQREIRTSPSTLGSFRIASKMSMRKIQEIVPEGHKGDARIEHFEVDEKEAQRLRLRSLMSRSLEYSDFEAGKYIRLMIDGEGVMMSNTIMEIDTNREFIYNADGNVLIAGLGIGMILVPILMKETVKKITVVESNENVIALVSPYIKDDRLEIVHANIFEYTPVMKYDTIYFDIWANICGDYWDEMKTLERKFRKYLNKENKNSYMSCWRREDMRRMARDDRY